MSAATKGTAHLHGITGGVGVVVNATVTAFNTSAENANKLVTVNEIGNKIEDTQDDLTITGSITLKIRSAYTVAAVFENITYPASGGRKYQINKVDRAEQAGDFVMITYDISASEYITLA